MPATVPGQRQGRVSASSLGWRKKRSRAAHRASSAIHGHPGTTACPCLPRALLGLGTCHPELRGGICWSAVAVWQGRSQPVAPRDRGKARQDGAQRDTPGTRTCTRSPPGCGRSRAMAPARRVVGALGHRSPWATLATVHHPESCPTPPARAPGWPDSAPRVRTAGGGGCETQAVAASASRRGAAAEDAQEGGHSAQLCAGSGTLCPGCPCSAGVSVCSRHSPACSQAPRSPHSPAGRAPLAGGEEQTLCGFSPWEMGASSAPAPRSCASRQSSAFQKPALSRWVQEPPCCLPFASAERCQSPSVCWSGRRCPAWRGGT